MQLETNVSNIWPIPCALAIARAAHMYLKSKFAGRNAARNFARNPAMCACDYNGQVQFFFKVANAEAN